MHSSNITACALITLALVLPTTALAGGEPDADTSIPLDFLDGFKASPATCYPNSQSTKKPASNWRRQKGSPDVWYVDVGCGDFTKEMEGRPAGFSKEYLATGGSVVWNSEWESKLRDGKARTVHVEPLAENFSLGSPPAKAMRCKAQLDPSIYTSPAALGGLACIVMCCAFDKLEVK